MFPARAKAIRAQVQGGARPLRVNRAGLADGSLLPNRPINDIRLA
jgi:hypothetical protein